MRLILSMLSFRTGHVLSVPTHCASVMPHGQVQRARFAASSALLFSFGLSIEKSTTTMSRSVYAMLDIWDTPYTTSATTPAVRSHLTGAGSRVPFLRSCFERAFFTNWPTHVMGRSQRPSLQIQLQFTNSPIHQLM